MFVKGIVAGWLIAALVWMLPSAEGTEIFVITLITYLIALAPGAYFGKLLLLRAANSANIQR
jgi:hypothetical protein